jgi:hypothetical protein
MGGNHQGFGGKDRVNIWGIYQLKRAKYMQTNPILIRKIIYLKEESLWEGGESLNKEIHKIAGIAVLKNPCLGQNQDNLHLLSDAAPMIGQKLMMHMTSLLGADIVAYGKAAIVGTNGRLEHAAALIHPTLGKPIRDAIGGGAALIPSNIKMGNLGTAIDVPTGHKDDAWSFAEIDTMTLSIADAPYPDEICMFIVLTTGGRPHAKIISPTKK